jgi:competence protein ComEA
MSEQTSTRTVIIVFTLVVLSIAGGVVLLLSTRPQPVQITINPPIPTSTPEPTYTPEPILIYVTGAVANPQTTVSVPAGSRVQDVIDAAGGLTDNANLDLVNLAAIVRDGDQVHIPEIGQSTEALPTPSGGEVVFVNTATLEELMTLPGIGERTAQAIIDYRDANGPFISLEDLDEVSGIGPSTLEAIKDFVSFD